MAGKSRDVASISYDDATSRLSYCRESGEIRWIATGVVAGCIDKSTGYRVIGLKGVSHYAHRLAWLIAHGAWPNNCIDHINRDRSDNRLSNLRDVSHSENMTNATRCERGIPKGVIRRGNRFRAQITREGTVSYLGSFKTPEEASSAYLRAASNN